MQSFIKISLVIHVIAGCIALLSGLTAIVFRKKVKVHKPFGKVYLFSMWVIFITALYLSVFKNNFFLLFIGIFTFHSCITAYRSLKLRQLHADQKPLVKDWLIEGFNILACGGLVLTGIFLFAKNNIQFAVICISFGSLGLRLSYTNIQRFRGKYTDKLYWLLAHIGGMTGSYIGAITAFTVNNNRWMGMPQVVAWLAPTVLLVPFIYYEFSRLRNNSVPQKV
jgi:uncharacterized membrane protein